MGGMKDWMIKEYLKKKNQLYTLNYLFLLFKQSGDARHFQSRQRFPWLVMKLVSVVAPNLHIK